MLESVPGFLFLHVLRNLDTRVLTPLGILTYFCWFSRIWSSTKTVDPIPQLLLVHIIIKNAQIYGSQLVVDGYAHVSISQLEIYQLL